MKRLRGTIAVLTVLTACGGDDTSTQPVGAAGSQDAGIDVSQDTAGHGGSDASAGAAGATSAGGSSGSAANSGTAGSAGKGGSAGAAATGGSAGAAATGGSAGAAGDGQGGSAGLADAGPCGNGSVCDGVTGLCAPMPACTLAHPCSQSGGGSFTTPFEIPECYTSKSDHPSYNDGPPHLWNDSVNGELRGSCVHRPAGATLHPLIIFVHGASGMARGIYDRTLLRDKSDSFNFYAAPIRKGFVLAADQGRYLPGYGIYPNGKTAHDHLYRDLDSPSTNPDVRNMDRLIDEQVAEGGIDTQRIYVLGWSNGGFFAHMYGVARYSTATPGGHNVAAVVSFASGDPFENINATQSPSCRMAAYPGTLVPVGLVHRSCDSFVGCNAAQAQKFGLDPGYDVEGWAATLAGAMADVNVIDLILDAQGAAVAACALPIACTSLAGTANHLNWPDGIDDGSGQDWEPSILQFLKDHPHP